MKTDNDISAKIEFIITEAARPALAQNRPIIKGDIHERGGKQSARIFRIGYI